MKSKKKVPTEKVLLVILLLSVLEIAFYIAMKVGVSQCAPSPFNRFFRLFVGQKEYIFDIINDLSLAYIMSYIFYMVVLIPERRKQQSINKYVGIYLSRIDVLLDEVIQVSDSFKDNGQRKLSSSPKSTTIVRANGRNEFMTYKEHFMMFYKRFSDEYQHLAHYIAFIEDDLRECLYEIVTSDFLSRINDLLINSVLNEFDESFEKSYDDTLIQELTVRLKSLYQT